MPEEKKRKALTHLERLPAELASNIAKHLDIKSLNALIRASKDTQRLFQQPLDEHALLHAVFRSDVAGTERILRKNPELLFIKGTHKMPFSNRDGTRSKYSVQVYKNTSPLALSLYTGDWNIWNVIYPFIPEDKIADVYQLIQQVKRGGPDLVKINRDPRTLSWQALQRFDAGVDEDGNPCTYKLLSNPDGIICFKAQNEVPLQYFYAKLETKTLKPLSPNLATFENRIKFKALENAINEMPMNSSCRTNDIQHDAIRNVFGQTLERNGIHFILDGVCYQDTYDGCHRLINAYRRYQELYHQHVEAGQAPHWPTLDKAWVYLVGLAQLLNMPRTNFFFCDDSKSFYPLSDFKNSIMNPLDRKGNFINYTTQKATKQKIYSDAIGHGLGVFFGLYKYSGVCRATIGGALHDGEADEWLRGARRAALYSNLAAIRLIDETTTNQFSILEQALAQKLQASCEKTPEPH